ncbi:hypothetical protein BN871_DO_00110 [Paenibacillus sp. P22]|nr:hypothetical protein BN871_DO_00110 [Paenibacillus sp. P22]
MIHSSPSSNKGTRRFSTALRMNGIASCFCEKMFSSCARYPVTSRLAMLTAASSFRCGLQQQVRRLSGRQLLHLAQPALDRPGTDRRRVDGVARLLQLLLRLVEQISELAELRLHGAEHLPYLARALLDCQRLEAHLEAVQQRGQRRRACDDDPELALNLLPQAGAAEHLCEEPLHRQEHDAEVGRIRRIDILVADRLGLLLDARVQLLGAFRRGEMVVRVQGVQQTLIILGRELGVDRQMDNLIGIVLVGNSDGELHPLAAAAPRGGVAVVLLHRQRLLQQVAELDLAERASRLDVGQHLAQIADAVRQALHLAESLMHELQPVADELERFAQPLLQRRMQLLVDSGAHLLQLAVVVLLQMPELLLHRAAHHFQLRLVHSRQLREPLGEAVQQMLLLQRHIVHVAHERAVHGVHGSRQLLAVLARRSRSLLAALRRMLRRVAADVVPDPVELPQQRRVCPGAAPWACEIEQRDGSQNDGLQSQDGIIHGRLSFSQVDLRAK